jgi:hypothetical protein
MITAWPVVHASCASRAVTLNIEAALRPDARTA